jgi:hypothetical protein
MTSNRPLIASILRQVSRADPVLSPGARPECSDRAYRVGLVVNRAHWLVGPTAWTGAHGDRAVNLAGGVLTSVGGAATR